MGQYIVRRVLQALLTVLLLMVVLFLLTQVIGDPVAMMLMEGRATEAHIASLRQNLGLDQPVLVQLQQFLRNIMVGDFGKSWISKAPVLPLLVSKLSNTVKLAVLASIFGIGLAIPIGLYAALKPGSLPDYIFRGIAFFGQSVPSFWLGLMAILLFAVILGILPAGGKTGWESYILPTFVIGLHLMAATVRLTRSSALEILGTDYIKLAKLKALPMWLILNKHVLRNAAIVIVTFLGMQFGMLVTRSVVIETVFFWPGFGRELIDAMYLRDFPVLRGGLIMGSTIFIFIQLFIDILYAYINPEIRMARRAGTSQ